MRNLPARSSGDESIDTNTSTGEGSDDITGPRIEIEEDAKDKLAENPVGKVRCGYQGLRLLTCSL